MRKNLYLVVFRDGSTMLMWSFMTKQEIKRQCNIEEGVVLFVATVIDNQKDGAWLDHYLRQEGTLR